MFFSSEIMESRWSLETKTKDDKHGFQKLKDENNELLIVMCNVSRAQEDLHL